MLCRENILSNFQIGARDSGVKHLALVTWPSGVQVTTSDVGRLETVEAVDPSPPPPYHSLYLPEAEALRKPKEMCEKTKPSASKVGRCLLPSVCRFWEVSSLLAGEAISTPLGLFSYR